MADPGGGHHFFVRRIHSLAGLLMGVFLIEHLLTNQFANLGAEKYNDVIHTMMGLPFIRVLEIAAIGIPFAVHIIYGLYIMFSSAPDVQHYPTARNWNYLFQRITGVLALLFIIFHVLGTRFIASVAGDQLVPIDGRAGPPVPWQQLNHSHMSWEMMTYTLTSSPAVLALYLVGLAACVYHFANGLWTFAIVWGITIGTHSQRVWGWCCVALFFGLLALGLNGLNAFTAWWPAVTL